MSIRGHIKKMKVQFSWKEKRLTFLDQKKHLKMVLHGAPGIESMS